MAEEKKTATIKLYRDNVPRITITYKNKKDLYKNFQKKLKQLNLDMGEVYWADWDNDRTAIKGAEDLFAAVDNNTNVRMFYRPKANKEIFTCPSCDDEDDEIKVEEKPVEKVAYESEENRSRSPSRSLSRGRHRSHSHDHPRHRSRSCDHRRHRSPSDSPSPHHRRHRSRSYSPSPDRRRGRSRSCPGRRGHHHHGHGHGPHPPMPPCFPPWYPWFPPCPPFHPRHHSRGGHHHGRGRSRSCDRLCQEFNKL